MKESAVLSFSTKHLQDMMEQWKRTTVYGTTDYEVAIPVSLVGTMRTKKFLKTFFCQTQLYFCSPTHNKVEEGDVRQSCQQNY